MAGLAPYFPDPGGGACCLGAVCHAYMSFADLRGALGLQRGTKAASCVHAHALWRLSAHQPAPAHAHTTPAEVLVGRLVVVAANLKPAKLAGEGRPGVWRGWCFWFGTCGAGHLRASSLMLLPHNMQASQAKPWCWPRTPSWPTAPLLSSRWCRQVCC